MSDLPHAKQEEQPIPFTPQELKGFDQDDVQAGSAIGKMLSLFFLYTILAMAVSSIATYLWVTNNTLH